MEIVDESQQLKNNSGKRIKLIRSMIGLTASIFSKKVGVTERTMNSWECGRSGGLSSKGAEKIVGYIEEHGIFINAAWLLYGLGIPPKLTGSVYGNIANTLNTGTLEIGNLSDTEKNDIQYILGNHPKLVILKISDDSMEPFLEKGDIVAGEPLNKKMFQQAVNKICIVETKKIGQICRLVTKSNKTTSFNLNYTNKISASTNTLTEQTVTKLAPIVWVRTKNISKKT